MTIETRAVLAGAYKRHASYAHWSMLTHAVVLEGAIELEVLCGRVKLDSLADRYASDVSAEPTCARCRNRRWHLLRDTERRYATPEDSSGD